MTSVMSLLLLCACLSSCASHAVLPTLSLRAETVFHRRSAAPQAQLASKRGNDFALSLHVSFATTPRNKLSEAKRAWAYDADDLGDRLRCTHQALCAWATAEEQAALVALGVGP